MKVRLHSRRSVQLVRVFLGVGEKVEWRVLERVRLSGEECFAAVTTELRMGEIRELDYTFSGLESLRSRLKGTFGPGAYEALLIQLASVFVTCHTRMLDISKLLLDVRYVFVDEDGSLRFAYLPLNKYAPKRSATLKWFLEELSLAQIDIQEERERRMRHTLALFAREKGASVTPDAYCVMLATSLDLVLPHEVAEFVRTFDPNVTVRTNDDRRVRRKGQGGRATRDATPLGSGGNIRTQMGSGPGTTDEARAGQDVPVTSVWVDRPGMPKVDTTEPRHVPHPSSDVLASETAPSLMLQPVPRNTAAPVVPRSGREAWRSVPDEPTAGIGSAGPAREAVAVSTHALLRVASGKLYPLREGKPASVGRGSGCDIQLLENSRMSRAQARIKCDRTSALVTDLGSANGTLVEGSRVGRDQTVAVAYGQRFQMAGEEFEIVEL